METKELLKNLEKDLIEVEKKGVELSGGYFLVVDDLQESINVSGKFNVEFLVNVVGRLFEMLKKENEDAGIKLLTMLCLQSLIEFETKKDAD